MSDTEVEKGVNKRNSGSSPALGPFNERHEPRKAINAISWSLGMKLYHTIIPCSLAFLMWVLNTLGRTLYTSADQVIIT